MNKDERKELKERIECRFLPGPNSENCRGGGSNFFSFFLSFTYP